MSIVQYGYKKDKIHLYRLSLIVPFLIIVAAQASWAYMVNTSVTDHSHLLDFFIAISRSFADLFASFVLF